MKKQLGLLVAGLMIIGSLAGCSSSTEESTTGTTSTTETTEETAETTEETAAAEEITVVSREDGSGTRSAFVELMGVEAEDADGNTYDNTTVEALITNSTSVMMTTVSGNEAAIGYISLGSLNDTVKAVKIDGVAPTVETIKDGTYKVARPFNIATQAEVSAQTEDFIKYIMSAEGQAIVTENGYIGSDDAEAYVDADVEGKIVVAGSSSVTPVMEKLKEGYVAINPEVTIEIQQSDSTTGMNSVIEGICDIGMASREVKDSELEKGITPTVIAMDGIAVIVNNNNAVEDISSETVKGIFEGSILNWSEVTK